MKQHYLFLIAVMLTMVSCEKGPLNCNMHDKTKGCDVGRSPLGLWHPENIDAILSEDQLSSMQNKGLSGDGAAAFRVSMHYALGTFEAAEAEQWETIAIEDGYAKAMYFRAHRYMHSNNQQARLRARYWFKRLTSDSTYGREAQDALKSMDSAKSN
jgi:hypothetical protein